MVNRSNRRQSARAFSVGENAPVVSITSLKLGRLLGYLKPYRGHMALAVLSLLLSSGLGLTFPLVIVRLLDSVTLIKSYGSLNALAGLLVGIFLLQAAFSFFQSYLLTYVGEHIVYDLRTLLYGHLQRLSLDFFTVRRVGEIVSRLSSDVTQMRSVLTTNVTSMLGQVVTLIGSIVIVVTLNASLTLFILGLVPVLLLVAFVFGSRIQKVSTGVRTSWPTRQSWLRRGCKAYGS